MKAYAKEIKLPWMRSTTIWKTNGTYELVFGFLAFPFIIDKYVFAVDNDGLDMQYSIMLSCDFWKTDGKNPCYMHPGAELSMLEVCATVHQDNESRFYGIMLDKIQFGLFPWKDESAIKSVILLTNMESAKDLFVVQHDDDSVPRGAEFQIPRVLCVVLLGQLKSH